MIICMFSLVKTYCINTAIIYLSKCISKLNENCTLVFRHITVVIWHSIHACDVPLQKRSIDFFINGSICMGTRVTVTLILTLTQILTLITLKTLIAISNSLWTLMSSIANTMPKGAPKMLSRWRIYRSLCSWQRALTNIYHMTVCNIWDLYSNFQGLVIFTELVVALM